ncbi:MAG: hypothetical protein J3K34DRAFT_445443, partial [Monoraphidium minutum]
MRSPSPAAQPPHTPCGRGVPGPRFRGPAPGLCSHLGGRPSPAPSPPPHVVIPPPTRGLRARAASARPLAGRRRRLRRAAAHCFCLPFPSSRFDRALSSRRCYGMDPWRRPLRLPPPPLACPTPGRAHSAKQAGPRPSAPGSGLSDQRRLHTFASQRMRRAARL